VREIFNSEINDLTESENHFRHGKDTEAVQSRNRVQRDRPIEEEAPPSVCWQIQTESQRDFDVPCYAKGRQAQEPKLTA
jgi:hypothetical protein